MALLTAGGPLGSFLLVLVLAASTTLPAFGVPDRACR
jgi:hypothetical protein